MQDANSHAQEVNRRQRPNAFSGFGLYDPVVFGLVFDGPPDQVKDMVVVLSISQGGFEIGFLIGKKATPEMALGRQPQPITLFAKVIAESPDKTQFAFGPLEHIPLGRAVHAVMKDGLEAPQGTDTVLYVVDRYKFVITPTVTIPDRHELDKADVVGLFQCKTGKIKDFVVIDAIHGHDIDFDGAESKALGLPNAVPDPIEKITTRNLLKTLTPEGIHTHIDAANAAISEPFRLFFQQHPVCGQGNFIQLFDAAEPLDEIETTLPNKWFSPGQSHLSDAGLNGKLHKMKHFFVGENVLMRYKIDAFFRHTVNAPEVASVCE